MRPHDTDLIGDVGCLDCKRLEADYESVEKELDAVRGELEELRAAIDALLDNNRAHKTVIQLFRLRKPIIPMTQIIAFSDYQGD